MLLSLPVHFWPSMLYVCNGAQIKIKHLQGEFFRIGNHQLITIVYINMKTRLIIAVTLSEKLLTMANE